MDLVGIGEVLDVVDFNDEGVNMFGYIVEYMNGLYMLNMVKFGFGFIGDIKGVEKIEYLFVYYGKM